MENHNFIRVQLNDLKSEVTKLADTSYNLSGPYFKLRNIAEKYFSDTFYVNEVLKIKPVVDNDLDLFNLKDSLIAIIEGLIGKVSSIDDDTVPVSMSIEGKQIQELLERSEILAKEIEKERERSQDYSRQIRLLSENLENEKRLMEDRYKELSKVELLKQEDIFIKAAESNRFYSWFWLVGIILSSIGLIWLLSGFVKDFCLDISCLVEQKKQCPDCGNTLLIFELTRATIYRVAIISLAVYFIVFVIKNYNALMHNYTINTQKANSFAAAFVMINGAITEKGKDDIMTQAAQAIFSHQNTGYIGRDNEPSNPMVIEKVIEKIIPKGKE